MSARGVSLIEPWCAHTCSFSCCGFAGYLRGRRGFVVAMSGSVGEMIAQDQASPAWGFLACPSMWGLPSYGWLRGYHWNRHSIDEKLAISYGYTGASTANPPRRHTVFRLTFRSPTYSLRILHFKFVNLLSRSQPFNRLHPCCGRMPMQSAAIPEARDRIGGPLTGQQVYTNVPSSLAPGYENLHLHGSLHPNQQPILQSYSVMDQRHRMSRQISHHRVECALNLELTKMDRSTSNHVSISSSK